MTGPEANGELRKLASSPLRKNCDNPDKALRAFSEYQNSPMGWTASHSGSKSHFTRPLSSRLCAVILTGVARRGDPFSYPPAAGFMLMAPVESLGKVRGLT